MPWNKISPHAAKQESGVTCLTTVLACKFSAIIGQIPPAPAQTLVFIETQTAYGIEELSATNCGDSTIAPAEKRGEVDV